MYKKLYKRDTWIKQMKLKYHINIAPKTVVALSLSIISYMVFHGLPYPSSLQVFQHPQNYR